MDKEKTLENASKDNPEKKGFDSARREFFRYGVFAAASFIFLPALRLKGLSGLAYAGQKFTPLKESDPQAKAMHYSAHADKVSSALRPNKKSYCHNCMQYTGKPGKPNGPCRIFPGHVVAKSGWCAAWTKKA